LETSGLGGVRLYEPGALTIVAGAGTPLVEIEALLVKEGQYLPFEPMDHRALMGTQGVPTIGGVIAANVSGPRRIQTGAARDYMLGVRFVDGRGQVLKNGGRVMKNVTGYDLVKLMSGSFGTLGVMSEVALKVLPVPQTQATVLLEGLEDTAAVAAMAAALGSPYDVSGAAHLPTGADGAAQTLLRVEGFEASVAYRAGQIQNLLQSYGPTRIETDAPTSAGLWRGLRDVTAFAGKAGDVWRLSMRPSDAPAIAARLKALDIVYDWGGGLIWALVPERTDARTQLGAFNGHATLVRASATTYEAIARFQPEPAIITRISQGLRQKFDPRGILNAGLMGATT
jgi:glycolate oxidase FAD binding subunit